MARVLKLYLEIETTYLEFQKIAFVPRNRKVFYTYTLHILKSHFKACLPTRVNPSCCDLGQKDPQSHKEGRSVPWFAVYLRNWSLFLQQWLDHWLLSFPAWRPKTEGSKAANHWSLLSDIEKGPSSSYVMNCASMCSKLLLATEWRALELLFALSKNLLFAKKTPTAKE